MAQLRELQPAFTAGELAPALWARVDLSKYASGLKNATNLFVHPHGGISNRAGFEFVGEVKDSTKKTVLIPFQFNTEQSYILEFGNDYFRAYRDGGVILSGGSPYEVVTTFTENDVADLVYAQEADVMYGAHPLFAPWKIGRLADDNWTLTTLTFTPATPAPTGLAGTARYKLRRGDTDTINFKVTSVSAAGAESAASTVSNNVNFQVTYFDGRFARVSWAPVAGAAMYRVYKTDGDGQGIVAETADTSADMPVGPGAFSGDGTVAPTVSETGAPAIPTGVTVAIVFGKEIKYKVSAINEDTGEESLPSSEVTINNDMSIAGNKNNLTWTAVAGADAYNVYKNENGVYGFIGRTETTSFIDENIAPDTSSGPQEAKNPFSASGDYPRCVTFIEQRLGYAGSLNEPQGVWLSQSANYENFGVSSPAQASDAVTFRIRARQVNEIRAMLPIRGLMLLTSGAEWIVSGGSNSDAIAPSAIKIDNQGFRGCANVQPVVVGNTILFAQDRGCVIRDFSYQFADDAFVGRDLTILARHLFDNRSIVSWAYAQAPYSIVWVVLDDGSLVSLTYLKEHDVWAWTHHESGPDNDALFEHVAVIAEGKEDVPYFIVKRTIGGQSKRYIERLHTRVMNDVTDAFFVDCGLTYDGAPATEISGLDHLEGETVVALADGNAVHGLVVSAGKVTLPNAASKVHVGLSMEATLQTLDLDLGQVQGIGTVQGRKKSISELTLRVETTRGIFIGPKDGDRESDHLVEYKQRSKEAWNEAIGLYTGDIHMTPAWDWSDGGNMFIKQFDPLPMTILAIMPDVTIGG